MKLSALAAAGIGSSLKVRQRKTVHFARWKPGALYLSPPRARSQDLLECGLLCTKRQLLPSSTTIGRKVLTSIRKSLKVSACEILKLAYSQRSLNWVGERVVKVNHPQRQSFLRDYQYGLHPESSKAQPFLNHNFNGWVVGDAIILNAVSTPQSGHPPLEYVMSAPSASNCHNYGH